MKKVRDGYKMTELGEIPNEWKEFTLQELLDNGYIIGHLDGNHGGLYPKNNEFVAEGVPYIGANAIKNSRICFSEVKYLTKERALKFKKGVAKNNDVLFAHNASVGPVALLNTDLDFVILSTTLTYYRCNEGKVKPKYLLYYMQTGIFANQYRRIMGQTTRNQVPITMQREFKHIIPPIKEQEKIASILSTIDEQIDNVDALIEKNKELKKGLMQTLLTKGIGHTKFKKTEIGEIPEEWEVSNLTNIVDIKGRVGWKGYTKKDLVEFGPLAIGAMHINSNNKLDLSEPVYLSKKKYEESPEIMVSKDDIILAQRGSLGKVVLIEKEIGEATINPSMVLIKNIKINSRYLYYFLCSEYIQKVIFKETSQTSIPMISQEQIGKFKIIIPTIKEQEKIASILSEVDKKIEEYENKKQKLEKLKKGLMQQLLTGMIRVTV